MRMTAAAAAAAAAATAVSLLWTRLVLVALLLVVDTSLAQGVVHLKEGAVVHNVTFFTRSRTDVNPAEFEWKRRNSLDDYFFNKRVVLFALPGAFTPTCSAAHLPGYEDAYLDMTRSNNLGIDEVYCTFSRHCWKNALNFAVTDQLSFSHCGFTFFSFSHTITTHLLLFQTSRFIGQ